MLCTNCGNNLAVYHTTKDLDGKKIEVHLCNDCMVKQFSIENSNSNNNFFNPIISNDSCKFCGCTFEEFSKTGLLGCPNCYDFFRDKLKSVIGKLQGSTIHYGKENFKGITEYEKEFMELNKQLKEAVYLEDYELASSLKEQILKLKDINGYK